MPSSFLSLLFHHHHHLPASSLGARKHNSIVSLNKSTALYMYIFSITSQSRDAILMRLYLLTPELEGPEAGLAESVALPAGLDDF